MTTHSRLSPSARYRWGACPASVAACAKYEGGGKSSASAIDGTHSHSLLEYCIVHEIEPKATIGTIMIDHDGEFSIDRDRADRVTVAMDYINRKRESPSAKVFAEKRVDPAPLFGRDDLAGTVDVTIIDGRTLEIIDYKDGIGFVDVIDNPQLEQYVFGVLAEHVQPDGSFPFDSITMTIIQPKMALVGRPAVSSHAFPVSEVSERYVKLVSEASATDDPNAPFVPGEKQCNWCPHRANCSAVIEHTLSKSGIKFDDLNVAKQAAEQDPHELSGDKLRELIEAAPMLRKLIEVVEAEALRRIQAGQSIEGIKAVRGRGMRSWSMDEATVETRLKRMGVPKGDIWQTSLISVAQIEKLRWAKKDGTEKQLTEKQLAVVQNDMVSKSEGKLTVVPAADKRPAVEFGAVLKSFGAVEDVPAWLS